MTTLLVVCLFVAAALTSVNAAVTVHFIDRPRLAYYPFKVSLATIATDGFIAGTCLAAAVTLGGHLG